MGAATYRILISRGNRRPQAELLPFRLRQPIPGFLMPLLPGDDEPPVALGALLHATYDRAGYCVSTIAPILIRPCPSMMRHGPMRCSVMLACAEPTDC